MVCHIRQAVNRASLMNGVMFIKCDGIVKNRWVMNMNIRLMNV